MIRNAAATVIWGLLRCRSICTSAGRLLLGPVRGSGVAYSRVPRRGRGAEEVVDMAQILHRTVPRGSLSDDACVVAQPRIHRHLSFVRGTSPQPQPKRSTAKRSSEAASLALLTLPPTPSISHSLYAHNTEGQTHLAPLSLYPSSVIPVWLCQVPIQNCTRTVSVCTCPGSTTARHGPTVGLGP